MMDWGDSGWSWWWMLPMMLFMVLIVGAFVWALLAIGRPGDTRSEAKPPTAEDILNQRFARGEIDATEYRERVDMLHGDRATTRS